MHTHKDKSKTSYCFHSHSERLHIYAFVPFPNFALENKARAKNALTSLSSNTLFFTYTVLLSLISHMI